MDKLITGKRKEGILQVFLDADLRGSHPALIKIAADHSLELPELGENQFVVFINKKRTLMKCYVQGNTFSFTRSERIDMGAVSLIPKYFGAGKLKYDDALRESLTKRLGVRPVDE